MPGVKLNIKTTPLPYVGQLEFRPLNEIDLVVIHCTELPDLATAREYGEQIHYEGSRTGNSGHYYVDRDGSVHCWVAPDRVAHHAGNYNRRSIGIELVHRGRWPDWFNSKTQLMTEPYPAEQIDALLALIRLTRTELKNLRWIASHQQLD